MQLEMISSLQHNLSCLAGAFQSLCKEAGLSSCFLYKEFAWPVCDINHCKLPLPLFQYHLTFKQNSPNINYQEPIQSSMSNPAHLPTHRCGRTAWEMRNCTHYTWKPHLKAYLEDFSSLKQDPTLLPQKIWLSLLEHDNCQIYPIYKRNQTIASEYAQSQPFRGRMHWHLRSYYVIKLGNMLLLQKNVY